MPIAPEDNDHVMSLLMPLHYFYAGNDRALPQVEMLAGEDLPEPERSLLFHEVDMTGTLGRYHGAEIGLEVLAAELTDDYVMRMVLLRREDTNIPVEFGAIGIRLEAFEGPIRDEIAGGQVPLGTLLERYVIDYRSAPKGYFATDADELIASALEEELGSKVYGRCNELSDADGIVFADIVEVLPRERASSAA